MQLKNVPKHRSKDNSKSQRNSNYGGKSGIQGSQEEGQSQVGGNDGETGTIGMGRYSSGGNNNRLMSQRLSSMRLEGDNKMSNPYNLGGDSMPVAGELVIDYKNLDSNTPLHKIEEAHPRREESSNHLNKAHFTKQQGVTTKGSFSAAVDET